MTHDATIPSNSEPLSLHDALPISPGQLEPDSILGRLWKCRSRLVRPGSSRSRPRGHRRCVARRGMGMETRRAQRSEEHTSELQSPCNVVCRLMLEKKHTDILNIIE